MQLMLNGRLISCTPEEYAKLISLGLIPNPQTTEENVPFKLNPHPTPLPDDINPPADGGSMREWVGNGTIAVPIYGAVPPRDLHKI